MHSSVLWWIGRQPVSTIIDPGWEFAGGVTRGGLLIPQSRGFTESGGEDVAVFVKGLVGTVL